MSEIKRLQKHKKMTVGDSVVLLESIENGLIKLNPLSTGRIIYLQNQVEATIWFRNIGRCHADPIAQALQLDVSFGKNGKLDGITVNLQRKSFAIKHRYFDEEFRNIGVEEEMAHHIPFFNKHDELRLPTNMSRNIGNGVFKTVYQYKMDDIIDIVSDAFEEWVKNNTESRRIKKSEKESGDFPEHWDTCLTDASSDLFYKKKEEIELAFAKATGIFYEFTGGLLFD